MDQTFDAIRVVVFDLDGTLADTAWLHSGRRTPADVLSLVPIGTSPGRLTFGPAAADLPALLLGAGFPVVIVTRSPSAYASTLLGLLDIDYWRLFASDQGPSVAGRLSAVISTIGLPADNYLYVGDRAEDAAAAHEAGCQYLAAPWLSHDRAAQRVLDGLVRAGPPRLTSASGPDPDAPVSPMDAALARLVAGTATVDDHRHLSRIGYFSWLRKYRTSRASTGVDTVETAARPLPAMSRQRWREWVRTGDFGALPEMKLRDCRWYLPDPEVDAMMARASETAPRAVALTLGALAPEVRERIATPPLPSRPPLRARLRQIIDEWRPLDQATLDEVMTDDELGSAGVTGALCYALLSRPGHRQLTRPQLQRAVFEDGITIAARGCILRRSRFGEGIFGLSPFVITRPDLRQDVIRDGYWAALRRLFPGLPVQPSHLRGRGVWAAVPFSSPYGRDFWVAAKGWRSKSAGSGQECHQRLLTLPADVLAAHIAAMPEAPDLIVPVPATPYSTAKPAQSSQRLAHRVAANLGLPAADVLYEAESGTLCRAMGGSQRAILIEDQITSGRTVEAAMRALEAAGYRIAAVWAWSSSSCSGWLPDDDEPCWLGAVNALLSAQATLCTIHSPPVA